MLLHWRANLADQNGQQPLKINVRVTYHAVLSVWNKLLIDACQHCSTSRANQALRSLANAGFQNRGVCLQAFLPSSPPHPTFIFWLFFHFSRGQNRSFFAPKANGNACYAGYKCMKAHLQTTYREWVFIGNPFTTTYTIQNYCTAWKQ